MADLNSKISGVPTRDLAESAVTKAQLAHDLVLELKALLDALSGDACDSPPVSPFIFPLQRMADRACLAADSASSEAVLVCLSLGAVSA